MASKTALITGASSGIGRATAEALARQGWQVTGVARRFESPAEGLHQVFELDLSELGGLSSSLKELQIEAPQTLVLNAGMGLFGGLEQMSEQQIRQTMDLNVVSNLLLLRYFLPKMKKLEQADIVLLGSEAALAGAKQGAVYCASKFAVRGLAQSLRADCAQAGIRVMLVNPGPTDTAFFDDLHFEPQENDACVLHAEDVASAIVAALNAPRHVVHDEINLQPLHRAFQSKK